MCLDISRLRSIVCARQLISVRCAVWYIGLRRCYAIMRTSLLLLSRNQFREFYRTIFDVRTIVVITADDSVSTDGFFLLTLTMKRNHVFSLHNISMCFFFLTQNFSVFIIFFTQNDIFVYKFVYF